MGGREKLKILVVDDERSNIDALAYILKPTYTVLAAKDGRTAVRVARENNPDLILLDVVMPGMSGFEVISELKNSDLTRGIPVIFITGQDSAEDEEKGFALGAVDYITKPFHNSVVIARVRMHLQMVEHISTIERLCMLDALTRIPNRRGFDRELTREWERAIREKKPISILMIDVDHFKDYNDMYGHQQGDLLLQTVAGLFRQSPGRSPDFVARWGGEEFAVLLPDTDLDKALETAERIRLSVEQMVVPCSTGAKTSITVSIGVNTQSPVQGSRVGDFIAEADRALYAAKRAGRNMVSI